MNTNFEEEIINEDVESINVSSQEITDSDNNEENSDRKEIEIVSDDGSTLDISGVSDTINIVKRDDNKPKNIVIPQERK